MKDLFFGLGFEVQSCWKKNYQMSQGVNSCLTAVSVNFSNTQKMQTTKRRTQLAMKYKVVGNQNIIRVPKVWAAV